MAGWFALSIRRSLVLLVLATVLPGMAILLYTGREMETHAVADVQGYALRQVQALAATHERLLNNAQVLLLTLAQTAECQSQDWGASQALLEHVLGIHPAYVGLMLTDPQGQVRAAAPPVGTQNLSSRLYFQQAVQGGGFALGDYILRQDKQGVVIHLAQAVTDKQRQVRSVLVTVFDFNYLTKIFQDSRLPEGSVLTITDAAGQRLTRYPEPDKYTWLPDLPRMVERMSGPAAEGTFLETGVDGVRRLYAFKRHKLAGSAFPYLALRLGIPVEEALFEAREVLWRNVALLGLSAFLALALAWFSSGLTILRPLNKLVAAALRLGGGDLSARSGLGRHQGELGKLALAFDAMAGSLEQREQETLAAQKDIQRLLHEKTECLDRLARTVAHEVRNPVMAIGGLAQRLLHQAEANGSSADYLKKIVADTQRLEKIVREVREYADLPVPCPCSEDLGLLMERVLEPFRTQAAQAGVELFCQGAVGKTGAVLAWVDRRLLQKTLSVLLANALEAMPHGGQLRLDLQLRGATAVITVADTGIGIAGEDMPYVFDPFFTTKANAVGINLSTVKRIATEHHWDIQVESQRHQGTTFTLTLPLLPNELKAEETQES